MSFLDSVRRTMEKQQDNMAKKYRDYERRGEKMSHSSDVQTAARGRAMQEKAREALDNYDNVLAAREARAAYEEDN